MNSPLLPRIPKPQRLFVHQDTLEEITSPENFHIQRKQVDAPESKIEVHPERGVYNIRQQRIQFMKELPNYVKQGVQELPNYVKQGVQELPNYVKQGTEEAVNLPLKASHNWRDLTLLILFGHVVGASLTQVLFLFLPLPSVNKGIESNRFFMYCALTFYELMITSAFVATFNLAMPEDTIPLQIRVASVSVGVFVSKVFDASIAEGWFNRKQPLFPVPFSLIGSISVGLPFCFATLYAMLSPKNSIVDKQKFWRCMCLIVSIIVSVDIAMLWAFVLVILRESKWQKLWAFAFEILKVICRNFLVGQIALRLNPKKLIALQFVVEIIFTGSQIASISQVEGLISFLVLLFSTPFSLLFRYYAGHDRLIFILCYSSRKMIKDAVGDKENDETIQQHFGSNHVLHVASGLISMSRSQVHALGMALEAAQNNQQQLYVDWSEGLPKGLKSDECGIEMRLKEIHDDGCSASPLPNEICSSNGDDSDLTEIFVDALSEEGSMTSLSEPESCIYKTQNVKIPDVVDHICESKSDLTAIIRTLGATDVDCVASDQIKFDAHLDQSRSMEQGIGIVFDIESSDGWDSSRAFVDDGETLNENHDLDAFHTCGLPSHEVAEMLEEETSRTSPDHGVALSCDEDPLEESPDQRQLYNTVDAVGSEVLATIIRVQFLISTILGHILPIREHVNKTYYLPDLSRRNCLIYGWLLVFMNVLMIGFFSRAFHGHEGDRRLSLNGIVSYIFRNNFWIIFLWLSASGILSNFVRINHFGADFSFGLEWLSCRSPGEMTWPGCV